jgi:DNA replication licensing factor MCM6
MISCNKSTVYVNFEHLWAADRELAEAIGLEFYRFEPYLRHAVHNIVAEENPQYIYDLDKGQR